ncbi:FAD:protein FMN transferase [Pseudoxanthomonas suwonensis]
MNATHASATGLATLGGETMGTRWSARVAVRPSFDLHALHAIVQGALDEVVAQMSTWEAGSDISRYRRAAAGAWQALPDAFARVLDAALEVAAASGGAFDPTVAPLVELWGFGASRHPLQVPPAALLAQTRALTGWQRVQRRAEGRELLQPGGLALDFSAIAKGFGADLAAERLRDAGIAAALVEVGGEIRAYGRKPDGNAWQVLVEAEPDLETPVAQLPPRVLALDDAAVATSGDRWHHFEHDGQRYSHTFDPRTGTPVHQAAAAVTVVAADAMHADAWATALTVMGADEGLRFAEDHGLAARFVGRGTDGAVEAMTLAFRRHLAA